MAPGSEPVIFPSCPTPSDITCILQLNTFRASGPHTLVNLAAEEQSRFLVFPNIADLPLIYLQIPPHPHGGNVTK